MLKKRIIPCLDIQNGRTVKGVNFIDLRDAGNPIALAKTYVRAGADELVFLDITATLEKRNLLAKLVEEIAKEIDIPFTVGGGIHTLDDAKAVIQAGADKVSINSSAVKNPGLITAIADAFGSQCVVVAIDTKLENGAWTVFVNGGKTPTGIDTVAWAKEIEARGGGEILLTSMNNDGTKTGFALSITEAVSRAVNIPVIASGGAGNKMHFREVFAHTKASAALAASIFHFGELTVPDLKAYLHNQNIKVRI